MWGISKLVHIASNNVIKKIQEHFIYNKVDVDSLKIEIIGSDIYEYEFIDKLIVYNSEKIRYDHSKSGVCSKTGEYVAYVYFDFLNLTVDSVVHELKHVYIDWCIFKNNGNPIKETKEAKSLYTEDFAKLISKESHLFPNLQPIFSNYYYSTKLEIPAFLENFFLNHSYINYKSIAIGLIDFKVEDFKNNECEIEYDKLMSYDIPRFTCNKNYATFLSRTQKFFKKRGNYMLKKIRKVEILINLKKK